MFLKKNKIKKKKRKKNAEDKLDRGS